MILMHDQQILRDRERALRTSAEDERRRRAARTHDDPHGIEAEVRVLIDHAPAEAPCADREHELAREAG